MLFRLRTAQLVGFMVLAALLVGSPAVFAKKSRYHSRRSRHRVVRQAKQPIPASKSEAELLQETTTYVAEPGDTLASIAEKFNTTEESLIRRNRFPAGTVAEPGLVVSIPLGKELPWVELNPPSADGAGFVSDALSYRGVPYRWAGTSSRGVDCSGLVYRVLRNRGIAVPRTAAALFGTGTPVLKEDLRPGDLVFFHTSGRAYASHVGIYIGDNEFVHASSRQRQVTTDSLDKDYYLTHYIGARRLD